MQFQAGKSGNPKGKAKGTRHRTTMAAQVLLEGQAEALTQKAVELALSGDTVALRLCLDRILPLRKGRPVRFPMPQLERPGDLPAAIATILHHVADGILSPEEGGMIGHLLTAYRAATTQTIDMPGEPCVIIRGGLGAVEGAKVDDAPAA